MPQVDKVTFFTIVFWAFVLYIGGFLLLTTHQLYTLLSQFKLWTKRTSAITLQTRITVQVADDLRRAPLVSIPVRL